MQKTSRAGHLAFIMHLDGRPILSADCLCLSTLRSKASVFSREILSCWSARSLACCTDLTIVKSDTRKRDFFFSGVKCLTMQDWKHHLAGFKKIKDDANNCQFEEYDEYYRRLRKHSEETKQFHQ